MEEVLKNMEEEKRNRIINSALEEFSKNSFEKASTNNIVKKAGISKGLLFHYFNNKRELYKKLEEYVIWLLCNTIKKEVNWSGSDLIERLKEITFIKTKLLNQYPYLYDFSLALIKNGSIEALKKRYEQTFTELMTKAYQENIDYSLFKENVDIEKAVNIIQWTLEKIGEGSVENLKLTGKRIDLEQLFLMVDDYLKILKQVFYK